MAETPGGPDEGPRRDPPEADREPTEVRQPGELREPVGSRQAAEVQQGDEAAVRLPRLALPGPLARPVRAAAQRWGERDTARVRRLRRHNRQPLPNLFQVHPEAHGVATHELGLRTVPVSEIAGTAVQGPDQRGGDFTPLPPFRGTDWEARWLRIRTALERLEVLPPIEVVRAGGSYWVLDGHNRVAAALYGDQIEIDALVHGLRLPGDLPEAPAGSLAAMLEESPELRAAGRRGPALAPAGREPEGTRSEAEPTDPEADEAAAE